MIYFMDLMINNSYVFRVEVELSEDDMKIPLKEFELSLSNKATELTGTVHKIKVLLLLEKGKPNGS